MAKNKSAQPASQASALTHHPFANLLEREELAAKAAAPSRPIPPAANPPGKPAPPCRVGLRLEATGRNGKVVTRITGLPRDNLPAIAARLRKALGCGGTVEGNDVLLLGSLLERASQWLDRAGDPRAILPEQSEVPRPTPPLRDPEKPIELTARGASGTRRDQVKRGQRVAIVQKADQASGKLTEGIVQDLLTNSAMHPRGIKVRLESGEVGRVKAIYG